MRRLRASSGLRHSCAEGASFPCSLHRVIPTKSIIRLELEQQMYVDSNIVHELGADCPGRASGLQALLEGAPPLPESKLMWHGTLERLLSDTRDGPNMFQGE